jgi:PAS domain S-box-containing protein
MSETRHNLPENNTQGLPRVEEAAGATDLTESMQWIPLISAVIEHSEDAIFSISLDGVIQRWNLGAQHLFEYTAAEAIGRPVTIVIPPESQSQWEACLLRLKTGVPRERLETIHVTRRRRLTNAWVIFPLKEPSGTIVGTCAIIRDVTEARNSEAALRESEQRFRFAAQAGRMFAYEWDLVTDVIVRGQECAEILGLTGDVTHTTGQELMATIHPDDRLRVIAAAAGLSRDNPVYRAVIRVLRPDGSVIWLERTGRGFFDDAGTLRRMIGMAVDITERMRAEETLRESEEKFRNVFRNAAIGMVIVSHQGRLLAANSTFCDYLGYTEEEVLKTPVESLTHVDDRPSFSRALNNALTTGQNFHRLEKRCIHKNGRVVWTHNSASVIRTHNGEVKYLVGEVVDVTQQKLADEALSSVNRKLIEGQEQERSRIARELHDDISQRLAVITIRLQELRNALAGGGLRASIETIIKEAKQTSEGIRSLSHRLHSSQVEYLGILTAMTSFCKEFAAHHNVQVQFSHEGVPSGIPAEISLSMVRVLQESLQNAVKHSGVQYFEVRLSGTTDEIALNVSDAGLGFDAQAAKNHRGLGLISMRERLGLVHGALSVVSRPKQGTTIHARVPLVAGRKAAASGDPGSS